MNSTDEYLGDGVYASFDGYYIWLRVERHDDIHAVALEDIVFSKLVQYAKRVFEERDRRAQDHQHPGDEC